MAITYAGQPLLLNDPDGLSRRFIAAHIDQRRNALFGREPACVASQRQNPNTSSQAAVTIPVINYPERPPLDINQLYWPGGAMRWGCFLGLVDGATLNTIVVALSSEDPPVPAWISGETYAAGDHVTNDGNEYVCATGGVAGATAPTGEGTGISDDTCTWDFVRELPTTYEVTGADLVLDDESGADAITRHMHILTPRKITPPNAASSTAEELWLLPLVDVRYFWQQTDFGARDSGAEPAFGSDFWTAADWPGVFSFVGAQIAEMIGRPSSVGTIQLDREAPAGYLTPYGVEFQRPSESPALLLDAAAANIGCRVILDAPGRDVIDNGNNTSFCTLVTDTETAERNHLQNLADFVTGHDVTAGDEVNGVNDAIGAVVPERVRICFRDPTQSYVSQRIDVYASDLADPPTQWKKHTVKVFHETFYCPPATWNSADEIHEADGGLEADQTEVEKAERLAYLIAEDYYNWLRRRFDIVLPGFAAWRQTGYDDAILWSATVSKAGNLECSTRVWSYPPDVAACTLTHGNSVGGGPWYQVVSHPFTEDGGATGSDNGSYRLDRSDYVWCLPLPFAGDDETIRWEAESGDISLDGATFDPDTGVITTYGVDLTLRKIYFNRPWATSGDGRFAEFVGALFPGEIFKATTEQTSVEIPGAANHSVTGTVTAVDAEGIEILLENGSKILAERTAALDTWAVDDTAVCWFAEGRYLAANTSCSEA